MELRQYVNDGMGFWTLKVLSSLNLHSLQWPAGVGVGWGGGTRVIGNTDFPVVWVGMGKKAPVLLNIFLMKS